KQRTAKARKVMNEIDMAILLFTGNIFAKEEKDLLEELKKKNLPVLVVHSQYDIVPLDIDLAMELNSLYGVDVVEFSAAIGDEQEQRDAVGQLVSFIIKEMLVHIANNEERSILYGLVGRGDKIVLVCPVDSEAPHGRLILPQVMAIRDIIDNNGIAVVLQPQELAGYMESNGDSVKLVVTDSQVFKEVENLIPKDIPLTSFSILMARAKGPYLEYIKGMQSIDKLKDGDVVLMLESCTHHTTCDDIGRVKIPRRLLAYLASKNGGKAVDVKFEFVSGLDEIPQRECYALAIQCGGCMVTRRDLVNRIGFLVEKGIPVVNYGMVLAYMGGIMDRVSLFVPENL
ncbi:MAG: [Bacteroidales bacterium]|nr:[FeFe] hydrogenase H-cluster maturation GTPase HydF [Bacteroidales bacterium]